ncbi:MAG: flagellar assembly protein FliW [Acidobacteriota bacterium]|nr:flagellar assembly protein FliW [Acidobacteriota bacterium]MDQ7088981.1 flagellar assembly protein FliW [Acidobacteriota bacterium]
MTTVSCTPENTPSQAAGPARGDAPATIRFPEALPGLDGAVLWQLVEHEDARPFLWLRSEDHPPLNLLLIDPRIVCPGYAPVLPRTDRDRIGLAGGGRPLILAIVTLAKNNDAFANLRAPIVINPDRMLGAQVILDDARWSFREPILPRQNGAPGTRRSQPCSCSAEKSASR